jgi:hypothetical protein
MRISSIRAANRANLNGSDRPSRDDQVFSLNDSYAAVAAVGWHELLWTLTADIKRGWFCVAMFYLNVGNAGLSLICSIENLDFHSFNRPPFCELPNNIF